MWAKGDDCEALRVASGEWFPATIDHVFKKATHVVMWGDCGGRRPSCTKEKCACKGTLGGKGSGADKPLTAVQLRLPEEPDAKRRRVSVIEDDEGSDSREELEP